MSAAREYLRRIGHDNVGAAGLDALTSILARHVRAIPFENIDAFTLGNVELESGAVRAKLVGRQRGGWCFEHNLLLGESLRELGYDVIDVGARVLWNREPDAITPRTHRALLVTLEGRRWLVDAGFGGHTLTGALDIDVTGPQQTSHEPFRVVSIGHGEYRVESLIRGCWLPLFRFDLQPQWPVDFEAANFRLAHDPTSHFTQRLIVSRVADEGRHVLSGSDLMFHRRAGATTTQTLAAPEIPAALRDVFGISLDTATTEALLLRLERQDPAAAAATGSAARP